MHKEVEKLVNEVRNKDRERLAGTYDRYVSVKHQDGSEFKIMHASVERHVVTAKHRMRKPVDFHIAIVCSEHNGVIPFYEGDLEEIRVKPWKGRERKLKINSDL